MPAKKAATKSKKKSGSKKKVATARSRRSTSSVARKKRRSTKKAAVAKPAKKKSKAVGKKPAAKKKAAKRSSTGKVAKKKSVSSKKVNAKKATTAKAVKRASSKKTTGAGTPAAKPKAVPAAPAKTRVATTSIPSIGKVNVLTGPSRGFSPYQPKRGEEYMSSPQLEHFRQILLAWKRELMEEVDRTMHHMKDDAANFPDPNDRATQESEFGLELRTRDRERKLLKKIDSALARIDDGSYGYCEETGDEIGLRRLEARPVATLCVEAQERRELAERQFRDREDYYR
jgi:RNA polymerase-binding transcription factor